MKKHSCEKFDTIDDIIKKLPKTYDNTPVLPGSSKVWRNTNGVPEKSVNWNGWGVLFQSDINPEGHWLSRDVRFCYSTEKIALNQPKTKDGVLTNPDTKIYAKIDGEWYTPYVRDLIHDFYNNLLVKDCYYYEPEEYKLLLSGF